MESEIGEVDLWQHQDQSEQKQLEYQQGPTPALHTGRKLIACGASCQPIFSMRARAIPRELAHHIEPNTPEETRAHIDSSGHHR